MHSFEAPWSAAAPAQVEYSRENNEAHKPPQDSNRIAPALPVPHHLRRRHRLPHMPLRMIRAMHKQPAHTGRQHLPPNTARLLITCRRNRPHPLHRRLDPALELSEQILPPPLTLHLALHRRKLCLVQLLPLRIRQQPIQTPHHMPHLKPHRRQPKRPRLKLPGSQVPTPTRHILPRQFQGMQHPAPHRVHLCQRPSQPRLNHQLSSNRSTRTSFLSSRRDLLLFFSTRRSKQPAVASRTITYRIKGSHIIS